MNAAVVEYVSLCEQLAAVVPRDRASEDRLYDRLDCLWYVEMTSEDRDEAEARLAAKDRSQDDASRVQAR